LKFRHAVQNRQEEFVRKEMIMPTELVFLGGVLVVAAGAVTFFFITHHKSVEPPHFR
jgi:hypothetical protein